MVQDEAASDPGSQPLASGPPVMHMSCRHAGSLFGQLRPQKSCTSWRQVASHPFAGGDAGQANPGWAVARQVA